MMANKEVRAQRRAVEGELRKYVRMMNGQRAKLAKLDPTSKDVELIDAHFDRIEAIVAKLYSGRPGL